MPTVILRPTATVSQTGWNTNPYPVSADNNPSTSATQNNVTCNWTATLADLDSGLSGATINSFTISASAKAGRAGATTCALMLVHSSDGAFASENESWTGSTSTQTTSALTYAYINDCSVKIDPNTQGVQLYELYVTVDYTAATTYGNKVNGVNPASIGKVNGVATANISKVNGI